MRVSVNIRNGFRVKVDRLTVRTFSIRRDKDVVRLMMVTSNTQNTTLHILNFLGDVSALTQWC